VAPKKQRAYGVTRGSPLGVMPTLVVPSVLLVLIGTCPYFLSVNREIVVWSKGDCTDWSRKEKEGYMGRMGRGKGVGRLY
jgi:hypothetical protein